jgi:hypothetical protein
MVLEEPGSGDEASALLPGVLGACSELAAKMAAW